MRARPGTRHLGFTLMEVVIVLALLGLLLGVGAAALRRLDPVPESAEVVELRRARAEAVRTGRPVRAAATRFFPDGSARGPGVDPLTGAPL